MESSGDFTVKDTLMNIFPPPSAFTVCQADSTRIYLGMFVASGGVVLVSLNPQSATASGSEVTATLPLEYRFSQEGALCQQTWYGFFGGANVAFLVREVFYRPSVIADQPLTLQETDLVKRFMNQPGLQQPPG